MGDRPLMHKLERAYQLRRDFRRRMGNFFWAQRLPPPSKHPEESRSPHPEETKRVRKKAKSFNYSKALYWLFLWLLGLPLFVQFEIGIVYTCVTSVIFIYLYIKGRKKRKTVQDNSPPENWFHKPVRSRI